MDVPFEPNTSKLSSRLWDIFLRTYDLGFTAFGGPPVHFQILHRRFVEGLGKTPWIDEKTYQELFAINQALPGPASTKMVFSIVQVHAGLVPAIFSFLLWSLPAATVMYGLSHGVQHIGEVLPSPIYALLSGLNAATVGIIALAAVQLARKAITDKLSRILVVSGGCAGLCYNALWYFPVLIMLGGVTTLLWDFWGKAYLRTLHSRRASLITPGLDERESTLSEWTERSSLTLPGSISRHKQTASTSTYGTFNSFTSASHPDRLEDEENTSSPTLQNDISTHHIPVRIGALIIAIFFISFIILMTLRASLSSPALPFSLFVNMFLAGTIIFGGGPVVIPLLREYVVVPGWVSPRDFLLGLAIIQSLPGPNFNFAVYLGALTIAGSSSLTFLPMRSLIGALLAFVGIFTPGLWLAVGFQSVWRVLRGRQEVVSLLRGINSTAVGFVFTAVYRLWQIGYLTPENSKGSSLGDEPWWVVIAAIAFTLVEWFAVPSAAAIVFGGIAGVGFWGIGLVY